METNNNKKIYSLQALRALAFLGIFAEHSYGADYGAWGVSVFFILSGFLMMYSYQGRYPNADVKTAGALAARKIRKLYPLHLIMIIFVLCLTFFSKTFEPTKELILHYAKLLVVNLLLVQTWMPRVDLSISLNGPAWYLSVSLFLYFMFPFIAKLITKHREKHFPLLMICGVYFVQLLVSFCFRNFGNIITYSDNWNQWFTYCFPVFRLGDFVMGCLLGYMFINTDNTLQRDKKVFYTVAELAALLVALFLLPKLFIDDRYFWGSQWFRYSLLYAPFSLLLVYLFAVNRGYATKLLTNKLSIWLGNMSPYAFLIHVPVINLVGKITRPVEILLYNNMPAINMYVIITIRAFIALGITLLLSSMVSKIISKA